MIVNATSKLITRAEALSAEEIFPAPSASTWSWADFFRFNSVQQQQQQQKATKNLSWLATNGENKASTQKGMLRQNSIQEIHQYSINPITFHSIKYASNEICLQEILKASTDQAERLSKKFALVHTCFVEHRRNILFVTQMSIYPVK